MVSRKKEWYMTNATDIVAGAQGFPLAETGAPTDIDIREDFPLRNFKVENKSGVNITLILNPVGATGKIKFTIPNAMTLTSDPNDNFTFSSLAVINDGALEVAIGDLTVNVRNY